MSDSISRQGVIERVQKQMDRCTFSGIWGEYDKVAVTCYKVVIEILKRFPSTDEVEVVRCKDCKYAEPYDDSTYPIHCSYDFPMTEQGTWVKPNDFCSNGERKKP